MQIKILEEPKLEFANGVHICPKAGIETLGVYDKNDQFRQSELRLGIVGRGEGVDLLDLWIAKCQEGIEGKESKYSNLFRGFGGFSQHHGFFAKFLYGPTLTRTIQKSELNKTLKMESRERRVKMCVDLYFDQIRFLAEHRPVDVIICVIPNDMFDALTKENAKDDNPEDYDGGAEENGAKSSLEHNFRRLLKAKTMHLGKPLQLVLEKSLSLGTGNKGQQDDATRAWNFCTALYYKGNKTIPWRLMEEAHKPKTCYVGVGFYKSRDYETVSTSLAQVFDEFGHGVILRGSPVQLDKRDRRPYMNEEQAFELLVNALNEYDHVLMQMPARIVIHKSSNFREEEILGFTRAIEGKGIRLKDFVTIMESKIRLYSYEQYPPVRGTLLSLSESKAILYTKGAVNFYKTYPGMYVPSPLEIRAFEHDSSLEDLCEEVLGLTKMNWNNTQFDGRYPITLECSRKVGEIMKYIETNEKPQVSYSFYM
ncbi:hypothetical protein GCM10007160_42880 [Litchfieldella qijiaojingensis]|uniref:Protein argonaute n=1 Tax=Litchfieldella qijiaojingensis TaxID=980347 RepID=A0ABQ2ZEI5_9GAMM|nr:hypothetical protein [Halomonas qijiaojingensis]GGY11286.1 hypothetical protein GCM10007160_42880 [Halomonas qijiaojingensis]